MPKVLKKTVEEKPITIEYGQPEETSGTWKLTAMVDGQPIGRDTKLSAGSNVIYFRKSDFPKQPKSVTCTFTINE